MLVSPPRTWRTFLVEHYRPGSSIDSLNRASESVRDAASALAREGRPVRFLRSSIIPSEEGFLSFFEAASEDEVRHAYDRAGQPFERISATIEADA
jgi:hypothetical protein